ncbi:hypothetical protein HanXRQr2_Chr03g0091901 [Helianthus annuus]|uniref:Uncharacterized protein n=1 Tax=Helianthus annuus TaxID=4232 RepID=A0A9K3JEG7_HELAN|nr:hypothetical protein HanXRQr2_Chr03g0091901 [Helianthus annuus]KAJ0599040.1 hypothetical protein HanIR_Chr03g0100321 [Helianthus annuus]
MEHKLVTVLCCMLLISTVSTTVTQESALRPRRTPPGSATPSSDANSWSSDPTPHTHHRIGVPFPGPGHYK